MIKELKKLAQRILPFEMRRKLELAANWPPVGSVRFGSLRRLKPISADWGLERGRPVDRYYIEQFLEQHSEDIKGHVLEIGTDKYMHRFGGERVTQSDVLHVVEEKPAVTIIGDLTAADHIASNQFDCIILTQTLQVIYDVSAALKTVHRILKPGGIVLVSVPGISKISRYDMDRWGYFWSFTSLSVKRLFGAVFSEENIQINVYGNVLAAIAFLHGVAAEELAETELNHVDPDYELLITVRAVKTESGG